MAGTLGNQLYEKIIYKNITRKYICFTHFKFDLKVAQSCPTICNPVDCSLPGFSVHGILQARILEWVTISFSRGISPTQGSNPGLPHCRQTLYHLSHQGSLGHVIYWGNIHPELHCSSNCNSLYKLMLQSLFAQIHTQIIHYSFVFQTKQKWP